MAGTAYLRFYAELNDLLSPQERQQDVPHPFLIAPSVKDAIEAHGVPHTEVGLIVVNTMPVGFAQRLSDGQRAAVYPAFRAIDVHGAGGLRPPLPADLRFVADGHVAKLARLLRLLGFDVILDPGWSDEELARVSTAEHRVLLTRDRGLLKRSEVASGMFIRDDNPEMQIVDVVQALGLADRAAPFSRCLACNGVLSAVDKAVVEPVLQPGTVASFDDFRRCSDCGRVYWEGSHHARLAAAVDRVLRTARRGSRQPCSDW